MILPPGSVLQKMHFIREIKKIKPGYFIEIGPGNGALSQALLRRKWKGLVFELDKITACNLEKEMQTFVRRGLYQIIQSDFLKSSFTKKADLILSSMVIEHFEPKKEARFFRKSKTLLKKSGSLFCYVPGSPAHWGIEDDIAGHYRRYTIGGIQRKLISHGWTPKTIEGLTFPLSNIFLPISNWLVKKYETEKIRLCADEKTLLSGRRKVPLKTEFPIYLGLFLNSLFLYPFYVLQIIFKKHPQSLTLFFAATPSR